MSAGQFTRSDALVALLHQNLGGFHPGFRAVHAQGRFYAGEFAGTAAGKGLTRASHVQAPAVPASVRFSPALSGDPAAAGGKIVGMATKFYLPDGQVTDLVAANLPVFVTRTPDELVELLTSLRPDPATGVADPVAVATFLDGHPATQQALRRLQQCAIPTSFARTAFHAVHAFRFFDAAGVERVARYHWEPEAAAAAQVEERLVGSVPNPSSDQAETLYRDLERRLGRGPVAFALVLELAEPDDPTDDPTVLWPAGRRRVVIGRLSLTRPTSAEELGDPVMLHDPTRLTDGIALSDDPVLAARRGAYAASEAQRTGGWQRRREVARGAGAPG